MVIEVRLEPENGGTHVLVSAHTADDVPGWEAAFAELLENLWREFDAVVGA